MDWRYFLLGLIAYQVLKMLVLAVNREIIEHRQRKFLKLVNITFPDKKQITFISLDTSDRRSMAKLERQLREEYDQDDDRLTDRSGPGDRSRQAPVYRRHSERKDGGVGN